MSDFNCEMLVIARGASGITQTELARLIEVNQGKISRWEDGLSVPDDGEVERLSQALGVPTSLFFLSEAAVGAEVSFMYHRKRRRSKLSTVNRLHCQINILRLGIAKLLRPLEDFPVLIDHMDVEEYGGPAEVARMVRAAWKIPATTPIRNLVGLVESLGAIVVRFPFEAEGVDAVHMWPWGMPPLIFLNSECPADRERFSLAHEVGHMLMHRVPTPNLEEEADEFARELLLPGDGLRMDVSANLTLNEAFRLKLKWKASGQAIIFQAKRIGAISPRKYESLYKYLSKMGYRKHEPNPLPREQPSTLQRLVEIHLKKLEYSPTELAEAVFTNAKGFEKFYSASLQKPSLRVVGDPSPPRRRTFG